MDKVKFRLEVKTNKYKVLPYQQQKTGEFWAGSRLC